SDFPTTTGAHQTTWGGGQTDGVIFNISSDLTTMLYSSLIGGNGEDAVLDVIFNHASKLIICGVTTSTDFPTTAQSMQPAPFPGLLGANLAAPGTNRLDGFVTILDPPGGSIVHSSYWGT